MGTETYGVESLGLLKNSAFGAIRLFGLVFCVMATALIIPKDIEDRILYTILSKPVHRIDYLVGKALGVIALASAAIFIMDAFTSIMLWSRTSFLMEQCHVFLSNKGMTSENIQPYIDMIAAQGSATGFHLSIFILILECVVLTTMTLLISCITSGTIISVLLSFCIYFIGIFQSQAKILWLNTGGEGISQIELLFGKLFTMIFPNFGVFAISDKILANATVSCSILMQISLIALAYFLFHTVLSAWVFRRKEF